MAGDEVVQLRSAAAIGYLDQLDASLAPGESPLLRQLQAGRTIAIDDRRFERSNVNFEKQDIVAQGAREGRQH